MKLHLAIPHGASLLEANLPCFEKLLSIGQQILHHEPFDIYFCRQMQVPKVGDYAIAALSYLGDAKASYQNNEGTYLLRADAAHLTLQRDSFSLAEPVPLPLTHVESEQLLAKLNQHFKEDGLIFTEGESGRWYLSLASPLNLVTSMPEQAMHRNVAPYLPQGEDAARWNQLLNEVQMLLFEHPINQAREAARALVVNSVWLSGGGVLPEMWVGGGQAIYSHVPLARGIAKRSGLEHNALTASLDEVLIPTAKEAWVILDRLENLDDAWSQPAWQALKNKKIKQLTLHIAIYDYVYTVSVQALDIWKFWRKPQKLATFLTQHHSI